MIRNIGRFLVTLAKAIYMEDLSLVFRWVRTVVRRALKHYDPLAESIPMMSYRAIGWLDRHLNKEMAVFEYGSGGSTLFVARRVRKLVSVEHQRTCYEILSDELRSSNIGDCRYILKERCGNNQHNTAGYSLFREYVETIDDYPDAYFGLVIVDGRARCLCVEHAIGKVRSGGYLLLDDSNRQRYDDCKRLLNSWNELKLFGIAPYKLGLHETTIWQKPQ